MEKRSCQKVSKRASVHSQADFFFFFFFPSLSSWDYFLCAEPTRDQRAPLESTERIQHRSFESFHTLSICLFMLFVVAVRDELQYPAAGFGLYHTADGGPALESKFNLLIVKRQHVQPLSPFERVASQNHERNKSETVSTDTPSTITIIPYHYF